MSTVMVLQIDESGHVETPAERMAALSDGPTDYDRGRMDERAANISLLLVKADALTAKADRLLVRSAALAISLRCKA